MRRVRNKGRRNINAKSDINAKMESAYIAVLGVSATICVGFLLYAFSKSMDSPNIPAGQQFDAALLWALIKSDVLPIAVSLIVALPITFLIPKEFYLIGRDLLMTVNIVSFFVVVLGGSYLYKNADVSLYFILPFWIVVFNNWTIYQLLYFVRDKKSKNSNSDD